MARRIEFGQDGVVLSIESGRGDRHARTGNVRVTRGQKKIARGVKRREGGEGKLATDTRIPKGIRVSTPTSHGWRELKDSVNEQLAHAQ